MCGWGKSENVIVTRPSGLQRIGAKSRRWKMTAAAGIAVAILIITPFLNMGIDQVQAKQAIAKAKKQMSSRLYASAARTLNEAPLADNEMRTLMSSTVRWAHDISDVKQAKTAMSDSKPDDALESLAEIDEDFPQEDEAVDLMELAQDQFIDPELEISDGELDEIAFVPDDPELDNLDELTSEIEDELGELEDLTADEPAAAAPATPQPTNPAQPATPTPATPTPAAAALLPLYQMTWVKQTEPRDQDTMYTTNVAQEVTPRKDNIANFGSYFLPVVAGQIYDQQPTGKPNIVPFYRYWNATKTDHYYTTNARFGLAENAGYARQQIAGYIGVWDGKKCLEGTKPLFNLYSQKYTDNFYTTSVVDRDNLVRSKDWVVTRIAGCLW